MNMIARRALARDIRSLEEKVGKAILTEDEFDGREAVTRLASARIMMGMGDYREAEADLATVRYLLNSRG